MLLEILTKLLLSDPEAICERIGSEGYGDPMLLQELLDSGNESLLKDFRQSCGLTSADFAKLKLRFKRVSQEVRDRSDLATSYDLLLQPDDPQQSQSVYF